MAEERTVDRVRVVGRMIGSPVVTAPCEGQILMCCMLRVVSAQDNQGSGVVAVGGHGAARGPRLSQWLSVLGAAPVVEVEFIRPESLADGSARDFDE